MLKSWSRLAALAFAFTTLAGPALAMNTCWGPEWRRVTDPRLGFSAEFTADTYMGFGDIGGVLTFSHDERARGGGEIKERCSTFSASMFDLGANTIGDPQAFFAAEQKRMTQGIQGGARIVSSRRLTFQGYPAQEFSYTFTIPIFFTPATHRVLEVVAGNRVYLFTSVWGDDGAAPADSRRSFASIQLMPVTADPALRSQALLDMTINQYWLYPDYPSRVYFTPQLKAIADSKRQAERAIVKQYGYFGDMKFVRMENGFRVFRAEHEHAVVDWYVKDDGRQISALTWRKVSP